MRKITLTAAIVTIGLLPAAPAEAQYVERCEYESPVSASVSAAGANLAEIEARAGELRVEGREGLSEVRVSGRMCAGRQEWLDEMSVRAERTGDRVEVVAQIPERDGGWWSTSNYAFIDLVVEVPMALALEISDGSGETSVENVGSAAITDGSGELTIRGVAGNLTVRDGSGDLEIHDVGGEVQLSDGSGGIEIRGAGSVLIERDGSGSIDVENVSGSVVVGADGSGSISARSVGGDFIVRRDGSGGVSHSDVGGKVEVPSRRRSG